jgi:cell division protein ZipA
VFTTIILTVVLLLIVLAAGWFSHHRSQQRAKEFERELDTHTHHDDDVFQQRFDEVLHAQLDIEEDDDDSAQPTLFDEDDTQPNIRIDEDEPAANTEQQQQAEPEVEDEVIAFTVMAQQDRTFSGRMLRSVFNEFDLHFGDMRLFHRYDEAKQTVFSVANILAPGTLIPEEMVSMKTPGVLLFARLPDTEQRSAVFNALLQCAQGVSFALHGVLCDEQRKPLSDADIDALRLKYNDED